MRLIHEPASNTLDLIGSRGHRLNGSAVSLIHPSDIFYASRNIIGRASLLGKCRRNLVYRI